MGRSAILARLLYFDLFGSAGTARRWACPGIRYGNLDTAWDSSTRIGPNTGYADLWCARLGPGSDRCEAVRAGSSCSSSLGPEIDRQRDKKIEEDCGLEPFLRTNDFDCLQYCWIGLPRLH